MRIYKGICFSVCCLFVYLFDRNGYGVHYASVHTSDKQELSALVHEQYISTFLRYLLISESFSHHCVHTSTFSEATLTHKQQI